MPRVIVCDVNETLLDLHALQPHFTDAFGEAHVLQEWFTNVLLYSEVITIAGPYVDFGRVGGATLDMMASARGSLFRRITGLAFCKTYYGCRPIRR